MSASSPVLAAGTVVWRAADRHDDVGASADQVEVLLVHRPKYDDWSFPKGKCDPGEHALATAVRETAEESGAAVRLGPPLPQQEYATAPGVTKRVLYWAARPLDHDATRAFEPNHEVDEVAWLRLADARERLTYERDREMLEAFTVTAYRTEPLVVLRHTEALPRDTWEGRDQERGLSSRGQEEASALVALLEAYGVRRVLSSDAVRCTATVEPYATKSGLRTEVDHRISEEGLRGLDDAIAAGRVLAMMDDDEPTVVCSHRPVLPVLFGALGLENPGLDPGAFVVVHRAGRQIHATEQHRPMPPV